MSSQSRKVALFGNVNTEEVTASRLLSESVTIDGYLLFPNEAFANLCRKTVVLSAMEDSFLTDRIPAILKEENYDVILLGPDFMASLMSPILNQHNIGHIGATVGQLQFEHNKQRIYDVFPTESGVLPKRLTLQSNDPNSIKAAIEEFGGNFVLKFVGDYSAHFSGSPVGRVRFSRETVGDFDEILDFVQKSIKASGSCLMQETLIGEEFSANYAVDRHGHLLRLGENICYKRRYNGNTGPICDGTGSVSIGGSLPFLSAKDIRFIEDEILRPFHRYVGDATGVELRALLNLDMMKTKDGKIKLFEVNMRQAGGHTMSSILPCLKTSFYKILLHAQQDQLDALEPHFNDVVSLSVSAYPPYFPGGAEDSDLLVYDVRKELPDGLSVYTGWVDVLSDSPTHRTLRARNSPTLLFQHSASTIERARTQLYAMIAPLVPSHMEYRTDIGIGL